MMPRPRIQQDRLRRGHIPAPIGGINTVSAGVTMPAGDSIYSYNLIGGEYGLRSRLGWREWCTGLGEQVRTILPFTGSTGDGSNNRMFAATSTGIWDVSASSQAPTQVVTFPTASTDSGWGVSTVFVTAAGHFLCYCDEENGYYVYVESTATWTAGGLPANPITGVDPTNLAFVMGWKNRLWFIERDTGSGWYLDLKAITGPATRFEFGNRFKYGGDLRCLASWTHEGGVGSDDDLVAVSGGGDVLVYRGTDPASAATFGLNGVWYAGAVPAGRRLTTDFGGDLLLMSSTGIQSLSKLTNGGVAFTGQYETAKIANLFQNLQALTSSQRGWAMRLHPKDACLMTLVPGAAASLNSQLVMSLSTKGWHQYRDIPSVICAEPWNGELYMGTDDGRILVNTGEVDGVLLADPSSYATISWSLLTGFANLGNPNMKRVQLLRPTILSQGGSVSHEIVARYRWDITEIPSVSTATTASGALWDAALWDAAVWGGAYSSTQRVWGSFGFGAEVAIAIRGEASARMTLTGIDLAYDAGGFM